jgi:hypothetical protein
MDPLDSAAIRQAGAVIHVTPGLKKIWQDRILVTGEIE